MTRMEDIYQLKILYREIFLFRVMEGNKASKELREMITRLQQWQHLLVERLGPIIIKNAKVKLQAKHLAYLFTHNIIYMNAQYDDLDRNQLFSSNPYYKLVADKDLNYPLFKQIYKNLHNFMPRNLANRAVI